MLVAGSEWSAGSAVTCAASNARRAWAFFNAKMYVC